MHHNNFENFYTREVYAIPIPIGFIPIPIPIMSRMVIPMGMGFPWGFPLPCTPLLWELLRGVPCNVTWSLVLVNSSDSVNRNDR